MEGICVSSFRLSNPEKVSWGTKDELRLAEHSLIGHLNKKITDKVFQAEEIANAKTQEAQCGRDVVNHTWREASH